MRVLKKLFRRRKTKHVQQSEQSDCGPASISMILKYYKSNISVETLRDLADTDISGTTAFGMKNAFEKLNFSSDVVKVDYLPESVEHYPLIAHIVKDNQLLHYVVIYEIHKNTILISDPSNNRPTKINRKEFQDIWTGILILPKPSLNYREVNEDMISLFSNIKSFLDKKMLIFKIVFLSIILLVMGISMAFYYQFIIDLAIPNENFSSLSIVSISLISVYIFQIIVSHIRTKTLMIISLSINYELMDSYIEHVLFLPMTFFYNRKDGDIISRFLDVSKIVNALSELILIIFIDLFLLIGMGIVLINQNINLFWISLATIPVYFIIIYAFYKPLDQKKEKEFIKSSQLNSRIIESLHGIETIKIYNNEKYMKDKISNSIKNMMESSLSFGKLNSIQEELKIFLDIVSSVIVLWWGATAVMNGELTLGQMIAFNSLLIYFTNPLKNIINLQSKLQTAKIANQRLTNIMSLKTEKNSQQQDNFPKIDGNIEFKNISYKYNNSDAGVKNINFKINAGESLAIVGESGSGKSTIAKMLVKFIIPDEGIINIDNKSLNTVSPSGVRNVCTYVSQDSFFFSGTIEENLLFGIDKEISQQKIDEACMKADILEFIKGLPLQFRTVLDEGANNLSNGQKQRLAIARALIRNNDIIIFDEATSSLDAISEKKIINQLISEKKKTLIFIAHRLYVSKVSTSTIVLKNGEIIEKGTHKELLSKKQKYYELHQYNS